MSQFAAFYLSRRNYLCGENFLPPSSQKVQLRRSLALCVYGRGRRRFTAAARPVSGKNVSSQTQRVAPPKLIKRAPRPSLRAVCIHTENITGCDTVVSFKGKL